MKYGIMVVSQGVYGIINIGDYIQTLASRQFLPTVDVVLERETELKTYAGGGYKHDNEWLVYEPTGKLAAVGKDKTAINILSYQQCGSAANAR